MTKKSNKKVGIIITTPCEDHEVGEIVEVTPGHAHNYFFRKKLAVYDTKENRAKFAQNKDAIEAKNREAYQAAVRLRDVLEGKRIIVPAKANTQGVLYAGVGPKQIAIALRKAGYEVTSSQIHSEGLPIKAIARETESDERYLGFEDTDGSENTHRVKVQLYPRVVADIRISVIREEVAEAENERAEAMSAAEQISALLNGKTAIIISPTDPDRDWRTLDPIDTSIVAQAVTKLATEFARNKSLTLRQRITADDIRNYYYPSDTMDPITEMGSEDIALMLHPDLSPIRMRVGVRPTREAAEERLSLLSATERQIVMAAALQLN